MRIAVIGSGISGNLCARLLSAAHQVELFEANDYPGGHTNTVRAEAFEDVYDIDTGFMVFNHHTYPNFTQMLQQLNVSAQDSDMSFSVRCEQSGMEYQGSSLNGLFAQRSNLFRPNFYRMLGDVLQFNRKSPELLDTDDDSLSIGEYLDRECYGQEFIQRYLIPMGAAIWSSRPEKFREFPARFLVGFLHNHGLLRIRNHPIWKTIPGGAQLYVEALVEPIRDRLRLNTPVRKVATRADRFPYERHVVEIPDDGRQDRCGHLFRSPSFMVEKMSVLSASAQEFEAIATSPRWGRVKTTDASRRRSGLLTRLLRRAIFSRINDLRDGFLEVADAGVVERFGMSAVNGACTTVRVHDPRFYSSVALGGSLGVADAYLAGYWDTDDLTALLRLFARNAPALRGLNRGMARLSAPLQRAINLLHRNTPWGSRKNIAAHYDLNNEFFEQFLDPTMSYSCGIFEQPHSTLEEASVAKIDRLCRGLRLSRHDHLLEIGTGWGGFAIHAAQNYGCRVTTTTISREQYEYAKRKVDEQRLTGRIEVLLEDYRDLSGTYDKLVSVEMIEAVGHEFLPAYFAKCSELLKPHGMMALQAITIPDQRYDAYRRSTDFIQKHVFPGGCLPSLGAMCRAIGERTDMRITHLQDLAPHYARTLAEWRRRFIERIERIRDLGADEHFLRCWDYYFAYCEAGFAERQIGVAHILAGKPACCDEPANSYLI